MTAALPSKVDLVVVGSGPVGSAYVRSVRERRPGTTIVMIEAGPRLTDPPGVNVRNLALPEREEAQQRSEGLPPKTPPGAASEVALVARPGTHLLATTPVGSSLQDDMPAAAMSTNVGGMGAHWTCAVPRPGGSERIGFIPEDEMDDALTRGEKYLGASSEGFSPTPAGDAVLRGLDEFYSKLVERPVQPMPLAGRPQGPGRLPRWTGTDVVLGDLAASTDGSTGFWIAAETVCRRVLVDGDRAVGVDLYDLVTGTRSTISAAAVVVAADALRTPQVLWASGVRLPAVGRYLNDQPQLISAVYLNAPVEVEQKGHATAQGWAAGDDERDSLTGVSWIPFTDAHPFHGQIMQMEASPIEIGDADPAAGRLVVGVGYFCAKHAQDTDRVEFSDTETDAYGLPAMKIHYRLNEEDLAVVERGLAGLREAGAALGDWIPDGEPRLLPAGSSLHYQGTTRMGAIDDGKSVCDSQSRVWGYRNLFVGGNGVIPTATACNPTLTSVALAIRAAATVAQEIDAEEIDAEEIDAEETDGAVIRVPEAVDG